MIARKGYGTAAVLMMLLALGSCGGEGEKTYQLLGTAEKCDSAIARCQIQAKGVTGSLTLGPDVRPLSPFPVHFAVEGAGEIDPQSVVVDFQMEGMDMGMNRYRLQSLSSSTWKGTATLPVCTTSRMDWKAVVEFSMDGQSYRLVYPFHTETN